ncbi:MAG: CBS domain-containing protein [Chloroflexi bacterium]|nr:CBS domain-containing protein [Chloroflexota bacterium]
MSDETHAAAASGRRLTLPPLRDERPLVPPTLFWLSLTAVVVGLTTGYGAVLFIKLLHAVQQWSEHIRAAWGVPGMFGIMILGGIITGLIVTYIAPEAKGHGVPEVMLAIAVHGGRIRPAVVVAKALGSAFTIGVGGSAGREGPIVQIGAALGSVLGQWLRFSTERLKILVAAGAASGIAATFNAPIAGVMFALEVILGEFEMANFGIVVIAAVTASIVSHAYLGEAPAFQVQPYGLSSPVEIVFYTFLGVLTAFLAVFFIKILYAMEEVFDNWNFVEWLKPAVGMALTAMIGLFFPQVLGPGLEFIGEVIRTNVQVSLGLLFALAFIKLIATSFTLGSGNSGGVFAPALFAGAALGGSLGLVLRDWLPGLGINPGAYALVGMAATFAGAARAPITAIMIVFEMSNDYRLILPLMFATVVSTLIAQHLHKESIYTLKLRLRGINLRYGRDVDIMERIKVAQAMDPHPETVPDWMPVKMLGQAFEEAHVHGFPVLNHKGELVGMVALSDYQRATKRPDFENLKVRDIMTTDLIVAYPDENLWDVMRKMGLRDISRLPVVERSNPRHLIGVIRRRDIITAYNVAVARREEEKQLRQDMALAHDEDLEFFHIELPLHAWAVNKRVRDLHLPEDSLLVSVRRGRKVWFPHGDTLLQAGDKVTIYTKHKHAERVRRHLLEGPEAAQA